MCHDFQKAFDNVPVCVCETWIALITLRFFLILFIPLTHPVCATCVLAKLYLALHEPTILVSFSNGFNRIGSIQKGSDTFTDVCVFVPSFHAHSAVELSFVIYIVLVSLSCLWEGYLSPDFNNDMQSLELTDSIGFFDVIEDVNRSQEVK